MARREIGAAFRLVVTVLRPPLMALTRRDWRGVEYLPRDQGFVICTNHISYADPFTFGHFLYDNGYLPRYLAKESVFRLPLLGPIVRGAQQIPVLRESAAASQAWSAAVAAVRRGECVVVYPEGTVTRDPQLWPMVGKTGAARIALTTGCPVIPVAQWGAQQILPPYAWLPRLLPPHTVHVWAGPPVDLSGFRLAAWSDPDPDAEIRSDNDSGPGSDPGPGSVPGSGSEPGRGPDSELQRSLSADSLRAATTAIMDAITALLEAVRGEQAPTTRWDPRTHGQPTTGNPRRRRPASSPEGQQSQPNPHPPGNGR